ncbi:MAG: hypothetical protein HOW73_31715 [Polyangiaceae bacterium]|nr:hypothetical protein [Polyangiaceae bacterium]
MARFVIKTWNCFGAAQTAAAFLRRRGAPDTHRFGVAELATTIQEADVVCMQELFLADAEGFFDSLSHPHKVRDENVSRWWPPTFGGSGLGVASRFPIISRKVRPFDRPHLGTERFARKGMLHVRVHVSGDADLSADIITTHMQSGYGGDAMRVRRRQIEQLRAFVEEVQDEHRPFIICGDLNIDGLTPARAEGEYAFLRDQLSDFEDLGAPDDHPTFHPDPEVNELAHRFEAASPRQRIDYMLFRRPRPGRSPLLRAIECVLSLRDPFHVHGRGRTFASDHFAVKAVFEHA